MKSSMPYMFAGLALLLLTSLACSSNVAEVAENPAQVQTQPARAKQRQPKPEPKPVETVANVEEKAPETALDPNQYNPEDPLPAQVLYDAFYANKDAWLGKKVTVMGYYKGSTHSSATGETRVDLKAGQLGKTVIGCMIAGKDVTPRSAVEERAGVIMRGTISDPFFGQVILRDAVFMNRE